MHSTVIFLKMKGIKRITGPWGLGPLQEGGLNIASLHLLLLTFLHQGGALVTSPLMSVSLRVQDLYYLYSRSLGSTDRLDGDKNPS